MVTHLLLLVLLKQTQTELQQELRMTSSDRRKRELENKLAETEEEIRVTAGVIQEYEKQIQRLRGDSDRQQSHKRQGEFQ